MELRQSIVFVHLFCLLVFDGAHPAPACSPSEPPTLVQPVVGALEDALRRLDPLHNCTVQLHLLSGVHVISSGVSVSAASVALSSHPNNTGRPVVRCGDNMSHPGDSVNETGEVGFLTFWKGARDVSISGVDFEGCPRTVQFIEVDRISISDCTFRDFTQGPVNMYNCQVVTVSASTFENNRAQSVFTDLPSRLSGGGLSITIYGNSNGSVAQGTFNYTIQNCTFYNNSANSTVPTDTVSILDGGYINGRGGGVAFYVVHTSVVIIKVLQCNITNNSASIFGGGLYIFSPVLFTEEDFTIADNHFEGNEAEHGGGIHLGAVIKETNEKEYLHKVVLTESVIFSGNTFVRNLAMLGGAMFLRPGLTPETVSLKGTFEMSDNVFQENVAIRLGAAVTLLLRRAFNFKTQTITVFYNNTFDANRCSVGGIVSTLYNPVHFQDTNKFVNNIGPCVQTSEALVEVSGDMLWMNNTTPLDGGAVFLTSHAQLRLHPSANLTFVSNRGNFGAAIRAEQLRTVPFLGEALYNPMCFITFINGRAVAGKQNVTFSFINNTALIGSAMLLNDVVQCSFVRSGNMSFSLEETFKSDNFWYSGNTNTGQMEPRNPLYDISTPPVSIRGNTSAVMAYPRQGYSVPIAALDEYDHPTAGVFRVHETGVGTKMHSPIRLVPSIRLILPKEAAFRMFYLAPSESNKRNVHTLGFEDVVSRARMGPTNLTQVPLLPEPCPPGFVIKESFTPGFVSCQCDTSSRVTLNCDTDAEEITLKEETWALSTGLSETQNFHILQAYACPAGYCRCALPPDLSGLCTQVFTSNSDLDSQCSCHRSGYLCGSCSNGTGVTALLDRCERCSPLHGLLIAALVIADTIVILGVMVVSLWKELHLPSWIYPFIFFFQVAPLATSNFVVTFRAYRAPLFYLGSLLGLYFPYDFCLYPNATAEEVYAIKYIPLILASVICPSVIVAANCRGINVNYSGVWLIVMLLFNQVVYTSASVLNCPRLADERGTISSVWFVDGTVKCFTGGHIPLALWAILCLLLCVVVAFAPLILLRYGNLPLRLRVLKESVAHPFREELPHWYLVELMRRALLIVVIVAAQGKENGSTFLIMVYFSLYAYALPYKDTLANILECITLGLLMVLLLGNAVPIDNRGLHTFYSVTHDECGKAIPFGSHISSMMASVYYLPVLLLVVVVTAKLCTPLARRMCKAAVERTRRESAVRTGVSHHALGALSETTVELMQHSGSYGIQSK